MFENQPVYCMGMGQYSLLSLLVILFSQTEATIFPSNQGPIALGFGNISSYKSDPFTALNHQGTLALAQNNSLSIAFQSQYFVEGLNHACIAGNYNIHNRGILGIGYTFFGNQHYNEGLLKVSFSKRFFERLGAGISLDYLRHQLPKEFYKVKNLVTFEAGILAQFNPHYDLAVQVINPLRVPLANYNDERLPFIINMAIFYNSGKKIILAAEWNQIVTGEGNLRVGIDYEVSNNFNVRAGFHNKPINPSLGISYTLKSIGIHVAFSMHPYLNASSAAGLTYYSSK